MKTALVLSGGSIKGAFQAGAIQEVLESGIKPTAIYGISVGSLNGGFLADKAGRDFAQSQSIDWPKIGEELADFWRTKITSFDKIGKKHGFFSLAKSLVFSTFDGMIDTKRLRDLINSIMTEENIQNAPIIYKAGTVNIANGKLILADKTTTNLVKYIIASTAIPVVMPVSMISKQPFVDGGVRDVATLNPAIEDGADEIICILCQPKDLSATSINLGKLEEFAERIMEIVVNETVNNDIEWAQYINEHCPEDGSPVTSGPFEGYRHVKLTIIRPTGPLDIKLTDFNANDIKRIYDNGREIAKKALHPEPVPIV
ncbi:MAG: patatin-like phospholipase family protein [candidate division Zixibacteria bacterium]